MIAETDVTGRDTATPPTDRSDQPHQSLGEIELTPTVHFRVNLHAAVFAVIDHLRRLDPTSDLSTVLSRHPFLVGYLDAVLPFVPPGLSWQDAHRWWTTSIAEWEAAMRDRLALCRLASTAPLDGPGRIQLLCAGLIEEDSRFGHVFAETNGDAARRPTLEVLAAIATPVPADDPASDAFTTARRLVDLGLLDVSNPDAPRSEWIVHVRAGLWDAVRGDPGPVGMGGIEYVAPHDLPVLERLVLPDETLERCRRVAATLYDSLDLLTVRGPAGSDRLAVVGAIARAAGRGVVHVDRAKAAPNAWARIGPLAVALDAVIVVELDLAPGDTVELPRPLVLTGPLVAVLGATGGIDRRQHERVVSIDVPLLDVEERARRWRSALAGHPVTDLEQIASRCSLQGAHIDRVARSAIALAHVEGAGAVCDQHVRSAASELNRQLLDTLATRLESAGSWTDVVVGDFTASKLCELERRCRHREALGARLGEAYGAGTVAGVRAMFTGSSGTGKTLAARVLAGRLGLDVYRVDLAAVVDKYVGETEKNLHRVLTTAEGLDVVLLVDEGDSLLGRRTEVRTANDRFANLETNYLLQRLESYRGVVVVTTNAPENVDPAFQRRMDVVVSFMPPTPHERSDIWRLHLPDDHRVPDRLILELAHRCTMTGGQIRNAVIHAALLALGDGRSIGAEHVELAVASEYQKAGATSPYDPSGRRHPLSRARSFQQAIT